MDYITNPEIYQYKEGFIELVREPGLGVTMNEKKIEEAAQNCQTWKNPIWRNYDGTVAEW